MTDAPATIERCAALADLLVDGRHVATVRCHLEAGHDGPHGSLLVWDTEADAVSVDDWPERNDPDEAFDVDVAPSDDERRAALEAADIDARVDAAREDRAEG